MGFGLKTFYYLSRFQEHSYTLGAGLGAFAFVLYLLDCYYWDSKVGRAMRLLAVAVVVLGLTLLVCFISATHPYGPISMYIVITPMWLVMIRHSFYRKKSMREYVPWLSGPLFLASLLILTSWITWTWWTPENRWVEVNRLADAEVSGCRPDYERTDCFVAKVDDNGNQKLDVCFDILQVNGTNVYPEWTDSCKPRCTQVWDTCFNQFILWVGPFLVSLGLLFLCFFATFLRNGGTVEQEAVKFAKIWAFLLFTMWISASLAGAGAGLSTTLAALTLSSFVASAVFLVATMKAVEREEQVMHFWQKLLDNYGTYLDIAKGLLVATCLPISIVYLSISFLVQLIRGMNCQCSRKTDDEDESSIVGASLFTAEARSMMKEFKSWNLATVYTYAIYWGAGFIAFTVLAAKFTILFLSWLIEATLEMDIPSVTGVLLLVGVVMFLLPPVPGAPIYLTLGIVIVPVGRESFGLPGCIAYAMGVSLALKLFATFLQQKVIGGLLQNSVGIRQVVGINTGLIRSMKLCLSEKGLGIAKVSILCGGPDWPTSVLCGIMGLPLFPILVGTLPVALLVIPTVLAGSFTYMGSIVLDDGSGDNEFPWAVTAATMATAAAAMVMFGFMLSAAYYVEKTVSSRGDELAAMPFDEEVKKANDADIAMNEAYQEVTQWKDIPSFAQIILILSLASMITSCYMVQLFQDDAFQEYQLTYTIDKHLDGDWKNIVKPIGWVAILLFIASIAFLMIFKFWANGKARKLLVKKEKSDSVKIDAVLEHDREQGTR
jgi:hypothetical protein